MHEYGLLPRARQDGLLEEVVGEELLLYDQESHTAHCLSPIAARVWRHCDGEHDVTELAQFAGASENLVADALHELREKHLLVAEPELTQSTISGISRREAIGRAARYGAAAAAGSLIVSATAATPAMASSGENLVEEEATTEETKGPEALILGTFEKKGTGKILTSENECIGAKSNLKVGETCYLKQETPAGAIVAFIE
jgi:hypothetical protein